MGPRLPAVFASRLWYLGSLEWRTLTAAAPVSRMIEMVREQEAWQQTRKTSCDKLCWSRRTRKASSSST